MFIYLRYELQGPPHNCAVIFVDNSGADFILGILPFSRELLRRGTKVIFCANEEPSLNDITRNELGTVLEQCCHKCDIIKSAYESKRIRIYANGQKSPCLDLSKISSGACSLIILLSTYSIVWISICIVFRIMIHIELNDAIQEHNVDLLVIEGMARALHTNLNARFKCETLKLAVIKNQWLANRLGGDTFSIICKYEIPHDEDV